MQVLSLADMAGVAGVKRSKVYFARLSKMRTLVLCFTSRRRTPRNSIVICKPVKRQYLACHVLRGQATRHRSSLHQTKQVSINRDRHASNEMACKVDTICIMNGLKTSGNRAHKFHQGATLQVTDSKLAPLTMALCLNMP